MGRVADVYFNTFLAGQLRETSVGFSFSYHPDYLAIGPPLSFLLPLQKEPFESIQLFSFFDNLIAEGWLKEIQSKTQKIDANDRFGLLLSNGRDLAGAASIVKAGLK